MDIDEGRAVKGNNPFLEKALVAANEKTLPLFIRQQCKEHRGRWSEYFTQRMGKKPAEIHVDIGSYKGKTVLELAENFPDRAFIGVDLTYKRVFLSAARGEKLGLNNVAWCLWDAKTIKEIFSEGELSGATVFFPDPWANKKSQKKHRLITKDFVEQIKPILNNKGLFLVQD
jgi:tRNA (guanine-N7-)-methyltransferase